MTAGLPVMLRMAGRRALVVGGGAVGERAVAALMEVSAKVIVVSPEVTPRLRELAVTGEVEWRDRAFAPGDSAGAAVIFACTAERSANAAVVSDARRNGGLVLAADDPEDSDFVRMAAFRRGQLTIAVSTGEPSAPALAVAIRDRLGEMIDPGAGPMVEAVATRRAKGEQLDRAELDRVADAIVRQAPGRTA